MLVVAGITLALVIVGSPALTLQNSETQRWAFHGKTAADEFPARDQLG